MLSSRLAAELHRIEERSFAILEKFLRLRYVYFALVNSFFLVKKNQNGAQPRQIFVFGYNSKLRDFYGY